MPTKNPSSSNHGTRTFTLDSLTTALEQVQALHEISADLIAESVFGQPAQQGQGEPVALAIPDECPHIIVFDDADQSDEYFCGAGARPAALRRFEQISRSWNAHLFVRVARNSRDDRYPSATVADPAEVERLIAANTEYARRHLEQQGEVERLRAEIKHLLHTSVKEEVFDIVCKERDTLRAQMAEVQALLRDVLGDVDQIFPTGKTANKVRSYLSASAEPSVPVCDRCQGKGLYTLNGLCPKCGVSQFVAYKPSAPVEPLIPGHRLEAIDELLAYADPQSDAVGVPASELRDLVSAVRSFQVRALTDGAPVEIDEPVCRGAWQLGTACGKCRRCKENPPT